MLKNHDVLISPILNKIKLSLSTGNKTINSLRNFERGDIKIRAVPGRQSGGRREKYQT